MGRLKHSRESLMRAVRRYSERARGPLSLAGFCREEDVNVSAIYRNFLGGFGELMKAAGLADRRVRISRLTADDLLAEMDRLARIHGRTPTRNELVHRGRFGEATYGRRFGRWKAVLAAYETWKAGRRRGRGAPGGTERRSGQDGGAAKSGGPPEQSAEAARCADEAVGRPLGFRGLQFEPRNEMGVVHAFGLLAPDLEMAVESIGSAYPDCRAIASDGAGGWRRVAIEFEFKSSNFKLHGHDPAECDVIVCWEHDWPDSPVKVLELKSVMRRVAGAGPSGAGGDAGAAAAEGAAASCATKKPGLSRLDSESGCRAGLTSGGCRHRTRRGCRRRLRGAWPRSRSGRVHRRSCR
jgi:hypothetical protein